MHKAVKGVHRMPIINHYCSLCLWDTMQYMWRAFLPLNSAQKTPSPPPDKENKRQARPLACLVQVPALPLGQPMFLSWKPSNQCLLDPQATVGEGLVNVPLPNLLAKLLRHRLTSSGTSS